MIYQLWHTGYPQKDYALIKSLLPEVQKFTEALPGVKLPGILREKQLKWTSAVESFLNSSQLFADACKANETQKLLDATELLHSEYEGLVRVIRPLSKEIDAYHSTLYVIYHKYLPDLLIDEIQKASIDLAAKCTALEEATVPRRLAKQSDQYKEAVSALCIATQKLVAIAERKKAEEVKAAVEDVHVKYQTLEKMCD